MIALTQAKAQPVQAGQVVGGFDAFGNHPRASGVGDGLNRADKLLLGGITGDALGKVFVQLDIVRAQLGPQAQIGKPLAQVIQRNAKPHVPIMRGGFAQQGIVAHRPGFGQLDHHLFRA